LSIRSGSSAPVSKTSLSAAPLELSGEQLIEWGGAQRWICTSAPAATLREAAAAAGGHAVMFRGAERGSGIFA
jgi:glycolate oxidase FAD binding subunit